MTSMGSTKKSDAPAAARSQPVSLAPLSFEDAVRALAATPPMTEKPKPKRQPATRRKPKRQRRPA